MDFAGAGEKSCTWSPFSGYLARLEGEVVRAEDDVLRRREDRLAGGGREDVVASTSSASFASISASSGERHVHGHLVAVEVGVVGRADERVDADGLAFDEDGLERLDARGGAGSARG